MAIIERRFAPDMRCTDGHFAGNPIIPGAVLLSDTLAAIAESLGTAIETCEIKTAKFFHPVRPGERMSIDYSSADGGMTFTCTVNSKSVLTGRVICKVTTPA
jgi:3-hydroxyacyl-[acyl-carrier-protein] dehydratase